MTTTMNCLVQYSSHDLLRVKGGSRIWCTGVDMVIAFRQALHSAFHPIVTNLSVHYPTKHTLESLYSLLSFRHPNPSLGSGRIYGRDDVLPLSLSHRVIMDKCMVVEMFVVIHRGG